MTGSTDWNRWNEEMTPDGMPERLAGIPLREPPELPETDDEVARYLYDDRVSPTPLAASSLALIYAIARQQGSSVNDALIHVLEIVVSGK